MNSIVVGVLRPVKRPGHLKAIHDVGQKGMTATSCPQRFRAFGGPRAVSTSTRTSKLQAGALTNRHPLPLPPRPRRPDNTSHHLQEGVADCFSSEDQAYRQEANKTTFSANADRLSSHSYTETKKKLQPVYQNKASGRAFPGGANVPFWRCPADIWHTRETSTCLTSTGPGRKSVSLFGIVLISESTSG